MGQCVCAKQNDKSGHAGITKDLKNGAQWRQVGPLLAQVEEKIDKVIADGAYDGAPTYQTIAQYGDDIEVVIPPRKTAVARVESHTPIQRDCHLAMINTEGRLAWQEATGYG